MLRGTRRGGLGLSSRAMRDKVIFDVILSLIIVTILA
jgi:hypothetical protein